MAEILLETPVDPTTRMALPIATDCEWMPRQNQKVADEHHGVHPRTAPELRVPLAGNALRNSQLSIVKRDLHNEGPFRYHKRFGGPKLPDKEDIGEYFRRCVPAVAGFVSRQVIDVRAAFENEDYIRDATPKEWEFLRTPGGTSHEPYGYRYLYHAMPPIARFFSSYVTTQRVREHAQSEVSAFLDSTASDRGELARAVLLVATEMATADLESMYQSVYAAGQLHPAAPATAFELVGGIVGIEKPSDRLIGRLEADLNAQVPLAA